jgi:hypothetical protein
MDWSVFCLILGIVAAFSFVVFCLVQAFSITADYGLAARAAWFIVAALFVATLVGIGSHYAQQQDKERQCHLVGGLSCDG